MCLIKFNATCKEKNAYLCNNNLFYEVLYWAIDIVLDNGRKISDGNIEKIFEYINNAECYPQLWNHIINNPQKSMELIFESTGSHYYSAINNRYNFIANIFQDIFKIDFQKYMKNSDIFSKMMESAGEKDEISHYKINKPLPETLTIEDIISDMKKSRFLIRPNYQRSEVKNIQKASYLMESILLGINIPPLFIYKREDKIKEVVDGQQRLLTILGFLDTCTKDYLERILRLKPEFSEGLQGLAYSSGRSGLSPRLVVQALDLTQKILRGTYRYSNGEEQIVLEDGKYVKINFSSSGQQECVWILNLLFYYLVQQKEILFIIEEPESHLFPESQKYITELIALVNNCGHSIVLTTHSPYVLGTLNNLLYAKTISPQARKEANKIIRESLWLDYNAFDSWFVKNGTIENCMDADIHMIQNEKIDEISKVINEDFERLLELQTTNEESVVL